MPLSYTFHLIDHMCCSSIIVTHMLLEIVNKVRVIFWAMRDRVYHYIKLFVSK